MRTHTTTQIKDVVKNVLLDLEASTDTKKVRIKDVWDKITGTQFSRHSRPVMVKNNVLFVNVTGSSWLYMLSLKKQKILEKIKKIARDEKIKDIRFKIGDV